MSVTLNIDPEDIESQLKDLLKGDAYPEYISFRWVDVDGKGSRDPTTDTSAYHWYIKYILVDKEKGKERKKERDRQEKAERGKKKKFHRLKIGTGQHAGQEHFTIATSQRPIFVWDIVPFFKESYKNKYRKSDELNVDYKAKYRADFEFIFQYFPDDTDVTRKRLDPRKL